MFLPVQVRQVERPEVVEEVLIVELLVDAEVVRVGRRLWLHLCPQRDEVEPVRDVLAGAHQHVAVAVVVGRHLKLATCHAHESGSGNEAILTSGT